MDMTRPASDFIVPLTIGGLEGRMLHIPGAPKKSDKAGADKSAKPRPAPEILFVYGHHSSLERWWGLMQVLSQYGSVTMPDLPGFGGMDSFYKVGQKPTIDAMADYLAAFIKWRYKRKKVFIAGISFGFVVATRMLQRYPELTGKVLMFVSIAGFSHRDDFAAMPRSRYRLFVNGSKLFSYAPTAFLMRTLALNPPVLRAVYRYGNNAKFKDASPERFNRLLDMEVLLWRENDLRTAMRTAAEFMQINNCDRQIDLPIYHIGVMGDHYFDNHLVEQHLRIIFKDFQLLAMLDLVGHSPSVIADAKESAAFIPPTLVKLLKSL